jgi:hypothetical protein
MDPVYLPVAMATSAGGSLSDYFIDEADERPLPRTLARCVLAAAEPGKTVVQQPARQS